MTDKTLAVLLFDLMERDDIHFCEFLGTTHGYRVLWIGTVDGTNRYQFTPRRYLFTPRHEVIVKESDIGMQEALDMDEIDVLLIPGGPGSIEVGDVESVRVLVTKSKKLVVFGWGVGLLVNTGCLSGRSATADKLFFYEIRSPEWSEVNWQKDSPIVYDDKFITARFGQHSLVLPLLVPGVAETPEAPTEATTHPIDEIPLTELTPWQDLIKHLRDHSKHLVECSNVPIDPIVLADHPFLRQPASEDAIAAAQINLGVQLPEDYKEFLLVTNGTGFSGIDSIPGLVPVEELKWDSANEAGLDTLAELVDIPGIGELSYEEHQALPPFQRVLVISDPDDEPIVGMLDPAYVRQASRTIHDLRQLPWEEPESPQWITFLFVPYAASYDQFASFRDYVESRVNI